MYSLSILIDLHDDESCMDITVRSQEAVY